MQEKREASSACKTWHANTKTGTVHKKATRTQQFPSKNIEVPLESSKNWEVPLKSQQATLKTQFPMRNRTTLLERNENLRSDLCVV